MISGKEFSILKDLKDKFISAGSKYDLESSLLAAIASRESRGGLCLDKNGYGDNGNAYGIMQVDKRHHNIRGTSPASQEHINQAAQILRESIDGVARKHPSWPRNKQIQGGIAAYNFGVRNVQTIDGIDKGTTGNNYSADVLNRQEYLEKHDW